MTEKRVFSKTQKELAIRLYFEQKPIKEICSIFNITESLFYKWKSQMNIPNIYKPYMFKGYRKNRNTKKAIIAKLKELKTEYAELDRKYETLGMKFESILRNRKNDEKEIQKEIKQIQKENEKYKSDALFYKQRFNETYSRCEILENKLKKIMEYIGV